jgi:outer membrane protein assembly factor BamB
MKTLLTTSQGFRCALALLLLSVSAFVGPKPIAKQEDHVPLSQPLIVKWKYESDRITNLTPASDNQTIYLPLSSGTLIALSAADGRLKWRTDSGGDFSVSPIADERNVYVATEYREGNGEQAPLRGALRAISKDTGVTRWMRTLSAPIRGQMVASGLRLFAGGTDGRLYAFDKGSGISVWINQYGQPFSAQPIAFDDRLYVAGDAVTLLGLEQASGKLIWRYRMRSAISCPVAVANDVVYIGSSDGYVSAISESRSKLLWRHRTGAAVQAVIVVDDGLLAASLDNFAYLLSLRRGAIVWRQLLPGRTAARPYTSTDGALFAPLSTNTAIVLGLRDGKPVNTLPLTEENSSSAAPIAVANSVIIVTAHVLLAFSPPK